MYSPKKRHQLITVVLHRRPRQQEAHVGLRNGIRGDKRAGGGTTLNDPSHSELHHGCVARSGRVL